jgi:hypothetical protein
MAQLVIAHLTSLRIPVRSDAPRACKWDSPEAVAERCGVPGRAHDDSPLKHLPRASRGFSIALFSLDGPSNPGVGGHPV